MRVEKDFSYLNEEKSANYEDFYDETTIGKFYVLTHDFGSKNVFDTLLQMIDSKDFEGFISDNCYESVEEFMEDCHSENIYDVYESAADAIFDMAIYNDSDDEDIGWNTLINKLTNGDTNLAKKYSND